MRILIIEDEPALAEQLRVALIDQGYAVDHAGNGQDGLHLGQEESFDAVILDLGLPGLDGLSVLKAWRKAGKTMPVIILTARDSWSEKVAGIDAGADDYVAKPFHVEELFGAFARRDSAFGWPGIACFGVGQCGLRHRGGPGLS